MKDAVLPRMLSSPLLAGEHPPIQKLDGARRIRMYAPPRLDLTYLSWGSREYGQLPVEPKPSEGWHYFIALSGKPTMILNGRKIVTEPGMMNIADPSCRIGHTDRPRADCEILTWIWRTLPTHSSLIPAKDRPLQLAVGDAHLRRLKQLHVQSRRMAAGAGERNLLQIKIVRMLVDLCLLDARESRGIPDPEVRIDLAIEYLRSHLGEPFAVEGLREYLQISKAALYRLFQKDTGMGPRAFAQELRMNWAREQLREEGKSVKAVAYALGYRHPPDFSRAYMHHFGATASGRAKPPLVEVSGSAPG